MEIPEAWIREIWAAQLAAADPIEASTVLYVVTGDHDLSKVEMAYLSPIGDELPDEVLRRVGEERLHEADGLPGCFQCVRDAPLGGLAAMLQHELRHAEQFHRFGPGLFELNGHLRAALGVGTRAAERERYEAMPLEYDANRVAAAYARSNYSDDLEAMAADERLAHYARDARDVTTIAPTTCSRRRLRRPTSRSTWTPNGTASRFRSTSPPSTRTRASTRSATAISPVATFPAGSDRASSF